MALVLPEKINDLSWNQVMFEEAQAPKAESLISEFTFTELVPEDNAERAVRGFDLIVVDSFDYGETTLAVSADFSNTALAAPAASAARAAVWRTMHSPSTKPNLVGILAGGASETGVLSGADEHDIPVCHAMIETF